MEDIKILDFYKGVDVSSLPELEKRGTMIYDAQGNACDALALCKQNGVNSIRLRLWNEPWRVEESGGYCDLEHTVAFAKRIKAEGFHFLLNFHYSDFWADPGNQTKPAAWKDLHGDALVQAVYDYTKETLLRLSREGALPDMVQVGNEIRSGMLFPDGEVPNYKTLAALVNAGIDAVRDVNAKIRVMIHLDQGGRYGYLKEWFDAMFAAGMKSFDVLGLSYYPFWHGTFRDLQHAMGALAERYKKPVMLVETAHPWRRTEGSFITKEQEEIAGFPAGIDEQGTVMRLIMNLVASVKNDMGMGVYYWEPLVLAREGGSGWDQSMGVLDCEGKVLPAFREFLFERKDLDEKLVEELCDRAQKYAQKAADSRKGAFSGRANLLVNADFFADTQNWMVVKRPAKVDVTHDSAEGYLQVDARQNFFFSLSQEVRITQAGTYVLSVEYRGTNTTCVDVKLYGEQLLREGYLRKEKTIYPTDAAWMRYEIEEIELQEGSFMAGLEIKSPPVTGKIRNFKLYKK